VGKLHFVGIAGTGISAIASVELQRGKQVSGSDLRANAATEALAAAGAQIYLGHSAEHVAGAERVIISSAIRPDNPEVLEARRLGIPVLKRADYLPQLIAGQRPIAIAGTHGKTTTTAMIASLLMRAGLDPSFIVGSYVPALGSNAHAGAGQFFVIEADEYDGMFLGLYPWVAVITNIELDHIDCYPTLDDARRAFRRFAGQTIADGLLLVCADNSAALEVAAQVHAGAPALTIWTYGLHAPADWRAEDLLPNPCGGTHFGVRRAAARFAEFDVCVPGWHNVSNALAAIAVGAWLELEPALIAHVLREYRGAARRFELKGEAAGVTVIDDYAHHPTEIQATLSAARQRYAGRRIWAIFQPHTYTRTAAFLEEFAHSFAEADQVIVTDIYAAREPALPGVSSATLAARIAKPPARYIGALPSVTAYLLEQVRAGDVVITLGAGDGDTVGEELLAGLRQRSHEHGH
jgi:UDP-N-acetylmuramate--alanine ligase